MRRMFKSFQEFFAFDENSLDMSKAVNFLKTRILKQQKVLKLLGKKNHVKMYLRPVLVCLL